MRWETGGFEIVRVYLRGFGVRVLGIVGAGRLRYPDLGHDGVHGGGV